MHVTLYLAIMLTLSSIIAALSLLLMLLERRPRGRHTAMEHQPWAEPAQPGHERERVRIQLAVQRAIGSRRGEIRRRRDGRRTIILGGLPLSDDAEDEHDQDREVSQGWGPAVPAAAASGPSSD